MKKNYKLKNTNLCQNCMLVNYISKLKIKIKSIKR